MEVRAHPSFGPLLARIWRDLEREVAGHEDGGRETEAA
jgi:hypothetical protein